MAPKTLPPGRSSRAHLSVPAPARRVAGREPVLLEIVRPQNPPSRCRSRCRPILARPHWTRASAEKLPAEDLTTYIYEKDVVLLVPLKLASDLRPGPLDLKAKVSWLECEVQCVPGSALVQATLNVGAETKPSKDSGLIATWQKRLP